MNAKVRVYHIVTQVKLDDVLAGYVIAFVIGILTGLMCYAMSDDHKVAIAAAETMLAQQNYYNRQADQAAAKARPVEREKKNDVTRGN